VDIPAASIVRVENCRLLTFCVNVFLYKRVDVGDVADVSEVYVASSLEVEI
jgi:hypothetical protein